MIFRALACDYDGTLASDDQMGPEVVAALGEARDAGLRLILVTGRTFFELTRVCERLDLFDGVVAENGGVVYFPGSATIRDQAPPPAPRLLSELDRRGIYYQAGRVIIGTARGDEPVVREALATVGVTLELVYNRAALMLLPAGVSKGTGVRRVIDTLGLSFHDVLAIGDAENDLDLFEACGWAACPESSVSMVKDRADWVFAGEAGEGIARAITGVVLPGLLRVDRAPRHRVTLGWAAGTSEPATIAERGINLLIHGDPLSGKSWLAGALVERLVGGRYAVCVIDPEGDYQVLDRLPGVTWEEIHDRSSLERALGQFERDPAACVVVDLSRLPHPRKVELIEHALELIQAQRQRVGFPHWVVLDEAHYSLHGDGVADPTIGIDRKGFCLTTYRPSWLRASVVKAVDVMVLARTTASEELAFLRSVMPGPEAANALSVLPDLALGEFLLIRSGDDGRPAVLTFTATPRETPHVRHLKKYADSRVAPDRRFFFRDLDGRLVGTAESLGELRRVIGTVDEAVLFGHAGRGDFSRWVFDVFSDRELGRQLRKTELRWSRGEIRDLRRSIRRLITLRYGARA